MPRPVALVARLLLAAGAAIGTAFVAAIAIALVDLYLTGHGMPSLGRELVRAPALGVALSASDLLLLSAAGVAGLLAWRLSRRPDEVAPPRE